VSEPGSLRSRYGLTRPDRRSLRQEPRKPRSTSEETRRRLPLIAGGLSVALARTFRILEPQRHNPGTAEWQKATDVFDLLL